jgi:hypothetical protein
LIKGENADIADILLATESQPPLQDIQPVIAYPTGTISSKKMDQFRDELAKKMWEDYQYYITREEE